MLEETFGMIKPEGLEHAADIETRILIAGLEIIAKKKVILTENQFERIYGHVKTRLPNIYEAMKDYMTSNPVMVLRVIGKDAKARLLELRGHSNAADAKPGTIRGDYAKDCDYKTFYAQSKFVKNVFHAAEVAEAEGMINIFWSRAESLTQS